MCGIGGVFSSRISYSGKETALAKMIASLKHRGPDGEGIWCDRSGVIGLAHTRLAIQDLSPEGAQPMRSASGRFTVAFNGEIYNFRELRSDLTRQGQSFRGHSDTEVLLEAIEAWGVRKAVERFVGMFAFALWDERSQELLLVRDRIGIKPLYYARLQKTAIFASELDAIRTTGLVPLSVDPQVLALYLRHNYVPAPYSIYSGVRKLNPGSFLRIRLNDCGDIESMEQRYWEPSDFVQKQRPLHRADFNDVLDELDSALSEAVRIRMVADRPVGAFLSGGIDSSVVVALMQEQSNVSAKTFSIGFTETGYDEAPWAAKVAERLGTDHHELYISPSEAREVIPDIPRIFSEPFSDSSQIPTVLVSRLARESVVVSLSGDGGDELFAGYKRYLLAEIIWRRLSLLPRRGRRALSGIVGRLGRSDAFFLDRILGPLFEKYGRSGSARDKLRKAADTLDVGDFPALYLRLVSHWKNPTEIVRGITKEPITTLNQPPDWLKGLNSFDFMMSADLMSYLPDDILVKVDRASMSIGLEARVPLLDHRIVEQALALPWKLKLLDGVPKSPLRSILARRLPSNLIERPKMGFGVPISAWLRGPLREWAIDLLSPEALQGGGLLRDEPITRRLREHLEGERDWGAYLWDILMFQAWYTGAGR